MTQSRVKSVQREGLRTHPCGVTMFVVAMKVLFPILTDFCLPARKSKSQSHSMGCRPRVNSLWWVTMLNAELELIKNILSYVSLCSMCERQIWGAVAMASALDLLGRYA